MFLSLGNHQLSNLLETKGTSQFNKTHGQIKTPDNIRHIKNNGSYYPGLVLGEDFIPHKLAVYLDQEISELKNITFTYPEDYILILDEEIGVSNDIKIEMI